MLVIIVALASGIVSGTVTGAALGLWLARRPLAKRTPPRTHAVVEPEVDYRISQAAADWAAARRQPEAAGLVANKLRLFYALHQRRGRGRRWPR